MMNVLDLWLAQSTLWLLGSEPNTFFGFTLIWLKVYLVHVIFYLLFGAILDFINERNPSNKIQDSAPTTKKSVEIKQGLYSLTGTSFCLSLALWLQSAGYTLFVPQEVSFQSWASVALIFGWILLSVLLADAWFYAEHRIMHRPGFIRFHREHHLSRVPRPWTNDRFSLTEVLCIQLYLICAALLLPIPAFVLVAHRIYDQIKGMIGHGGYEYFAGRAARYPFPFTCVSHHDRHHESGHCNYGSFLTLWDRLFGTLEEGYDDRVAQIAKN